MMCDYCHAPRDGVHRYYCAKCEKSHASCPVESQLVHWSADGRWKTPEYIAVCPPPAEPALDPAPLSASEREDSEKRLKRVKMIDLACCFAIGLFLYIIGRVQGKVCERKRLLGKGAREI